MKKPKPSPLVTTPPLPRSRTAFFLLLCPNCKRNTFASREADEGWMFLDCQNCETIVKIEWVER